MSFEGKSTTVWRLPGGGETLAVAAHEKPVEGVAFNPYGTAIATAGGGDRLKLWDLSGKRLKDIDSGLAEAVAYGRDGSLAVSHGNEVLLWQAGKQPAKAAGRRDDQRTLLSALTETALRRQA